MSSSQHFATHASRAYVPVPSKGPTNEQIATYMQIGIWGAVFLLLLVSLPRAIMRWRHPSVRKHGMRLMSAKSSSSTLVATRVPDLPHKALKQSTSEEWIEKNDGLYSPDEPGTPVEQPTTTATAVYSRVASIGSTFYPVYRFLNRPLWVFGCSIGLGICIAAYTGIMSFAWLYRNLPNFGPRRPGWIVVGQMPLVIFLSTKNNMLGFAFGMGYEKLNVYHRIVGLVMFLAGLAHVVGYLVLFAKKGVLTAVLPTLYTGWIAWAGFCLLVVFSLPIMRTSAYRLFWHAHWVGYILMFVALSFHAEHSWYYAVAGAGILVIDHILRLFKTHLVVATVSVVPGLKCTRIEVSQLTKGWRAGQHVRLRTVSSSMGVVNMFETHPFTIASVAENRRGEGLVLYAKACGDWTNKLYGIAQRSNSVDLTERAGSKESVVEHSTTMRMVMEGPYGGHGHDVPSTFTSALFIAGGSGITWGLSTVDGILRDVELGLANTRLLVLVWVVRDPASLTHMQQDFATFIDRASRLRSIQLKIEVFYTRAVPTDVSDSFRNATFPRNLTLNPGRPRLESMMDSVVDQTKALGGRLTGLVIGFCGPTGLAEGVESAERTISGKKRKSIGGVELISEAFDW